MKIVSYLSDFWTICCRLYHSLLSEVHSRLRGICGEYGNTSLTSFAALRASCGTRRKRDICSNHPSSYEMINTIKICGIQFEERSSPAVLCRNSCAPSDDRVGSPNKYQNRGSLYIWVAPSTSPNHTVYAPNNNVFQWGKTGFSCPTR